MIIFIVGPTAVGKSHIALELAHCLQGEIVSCDAMQVYRQITIASDKPDNKTLQSIPHHLIDVVSIEEEFNVASYRVLAERAILDIIRRGKIAVVCGGSGMYMAALLDGIFEGGTVDPVIRQRLEAEAKDDLRRLYQRLTEVDPASAQKIKSNDPQRIIRALEIFDATGVPISILQQQRSGLWGKQDMRLIALNRPRHELYSRVEARIDEMFKRGLIEEVKAVRQKKMTTTVSKLIGIPEVSGFLDGQHTIEQAQYLMKLHTRHYVKRQLTWFRRDTRLEWIDLVQTSTAQHTATIIKDLLHERKSSHCVG